MPIAVAEDTVLHIKMQNTDIPGEFVAKGKVQLEAGWKLIEGIDAKETILPAVKKGDVLPLIKSEINEV